MTSQEEQPFNVNTQQASKFEIFMAKLFGRKYVMEDKDWGMTYYSYRGRIYVTEYHDYEENYHL